VILDYLARTTGHFEPTGEQDRWQARNWLSGRPIHITNTLGSATSAGVPSTRGDGARRRSPRPR
jgi:hypothetical protein